MSKEELTSERKLLEPHSVWEIHTILQACLSEDLHFDDFLLQLRIFDFECVERQDVAIRCKIGTLNIDNHIPGHVNSKYTTHNHSFASIRTGTRKYCRT